MSNNVQALQQCRECGAALQERKAHQARTPFRERAEAEQILGWIAFDPSKEENARVLKSADEFDLMKNARGELIYAVKNIPELSKQEALLVKEVLQEFREREIEKEQHALIENTLEAYCRKNFLKLDADQRDYLSRVLDSLIFDFGPISWMLRDEHLEEIAIIGLGREKPVQVYYVGMGWLRSNVCFTDETVVRNLINKMSRKIGRRLTLQTPKLNATLPGGARLNASMEPIAFTGPNATIRKFRAKPFTPQDLVRQGTVSAEALAFLWMLMETDFSLLIGGNTGSGKTSTLNALFEFVPKDERIIVVEETPEINLPHRHLVKLNVVDNLGIGMKELIVDTLRMRPDRIVVGEIRNPEEVSAFVDTLLAGQGKGSYATFHAQSGSEALTRLKKLGVLEMDLASIDLILVQKRWNSIDLASNARTEVRRVIELSEVVMQQGRAGLNTLFEFDYAGKTLQKKNESTRLREKLCRTFGLSEAALGEELARRERLLLETADKNAAVEATVLV